MNRLFKYVMMAMAAVFVFGSCNEFEMLEAATGYLSVSLQKDDEVHSKALVAPAPDQVFSLTIHDEGHLVYTASCGDKDEVGHFAATDGFAVGSAFAD